MATKTTPFSQIQNPKWQAKAGDFLKELLQTELKMFEDAQQAYKQAVDTSASNVKELEHAFKECGYSTQLAMFLLPPEASLDIFKNNTTYSLNTEEEQRLLDALNAQRELNTVESFKKGDIIIPGEDDVKRYSVKRK